MGCVNVPDLQKLNVFDNNIGEARLASLSRPGLCVEV